MLEAPIRLSAIHALVLEHVPSYPFISEHRSKNLAAVECEDVNAAELLHEHDDHGARYRPPVPRDRPELEEPIASLLSNVVFPIE